MLQNNKYLLIINPVSGKKKWRDHTQLISAFLNAHHIAPNIFYSEYQGHIKAYLAELKEPVFSNILIYGGDGTFNEAINGILSRLDNYNPTIGFLPGGSGNAVLHDLDNCTIKDALQTIINKKRKSIDVMQIEYHNHIEYSINILGWGMVADIALLSEKLRFLGSLRYTLVSLLYIFNLKSQYATIKIDGNQDTDYFLFITLTNTIYTGKGMMIAPKALMDDGLLDLIIIKNNIGRLALIKLFIQIFKGEHIHSKYVDYHHIKTFSIQSKNQEPLNIDGEIKGSTPVKVTILENKLSIYSKN